MNGGRRAGRPRTFASLARAGTFLGTAPEGGAGVVVGRAVANTEFMKALIRWGSFERFTFFVGEARDAAPLEAHFVATGLIPADRLALSNLLTLPETIATGGLDVFHLGEFSSAFADVVWLRDRYARGPLPVTAQIHSLSYPRFLGDYLRAQLHPAGAGDAIICSSTAGKNAVLACFASAEAALGRVGAKVKSPACPLPVIPLGVDVDRLAAGDRAATRARLNLPDAACVVLGMGRFTEYDKMDLFPLLQVFAAVVARMPAGIEPPYLILAGARQGTQTPEMIRLWAKLLGVGDRVILEIDFPEREKANLLAAADVFVSPSDNLQETFGLSVVEAMAAGLPVIVSDFDGYKDTVTNDVGVRIEARLATSLARVSELSPLLYERPLHLLLGQAMEIDLGALEAALYEMVVDRERRTRLGQAAAARARASYDWPVVIAAYERLWQELSTAWGPGGTDLGAYPPLAMAFEEIFASFPSGRLDPSRRFARTALADRLVKDGPRPENRYLIYPELRNVFGDGDVVALLATLTTPLTVAELTAADKAARPQVEDWRRGHAIAWLVKHGLIA